MQRWVQVIIVVAIGIVGVTALVAWRLAAPPPPPPPMTADDLTALRMQATDLQRAVETLARSDTPDPAALAALADRLDALTRRLDQMQGATE